MIKRWQHIIASITISCILGAECAFGESITYNNKKVREAIQQLCFMDCFSKTAIEVTEECPPEINMKIGLCGPGCMLSKEEKDRKTLDSFHLDAGERVVVKKGDENRIYMYLELNKILERYTGYSDGYKIWKQIYDVAKGDNLLEMAISGIHCSVSIHLCSFYSEEPEKRRLYMNYQLMEKKVRPEYVKNMKNTLDMLLSLLPASFETISAVANRYKGCTEIVEKIREAIPDVTPVYSGYQVGQDTLEKASKISSIVGCINCMRCKVWGKVQLEGLKCAVKLLLKEKDESIKITEREIVYFVNLINRLSSAATLYERFIIQRAYQMQIYEQKQNYLTNIVDGAYCAVCFRMLRSSTEASKCRRYA